MAPNGSGKKGPGGQTRGREPEARRAELREWCKPSFDGPQPAGINVFGWIMTGVGLLAALGFVGLLCYSVVNLLRHRALAGEHLFAAGIGLLFALFFARVWHGFRTLPDWRVALDVPRSAKLFSAGGSALSACGAAGALATLIFAVCAKATFLRFMENIGSANVGKVQVIFTSGVLFFHFLLLWYLFQGMMELREWVRTALAMVLLGTTALAVAGVIADTWVLSDVLENRGITVVCSVAGLLAALGVLLQLAMVGEDAAPHFRANEP